MDGPLLADQELIYKSSVQLLDAVWKWMIGMEGEREPGKSMLGEKIDDDHQVVLIAQIPLRLSCHTFPLAIALSRSSRQHPVSAQT